MAHQKFRIGYPAPGNRILVAERGQYALNGFQANLTHSGSSGLTWNTHSPSYIPVIPGHGGYGMDTPGGTGRHLLTPATSIFLIDRLDSAEVGSARPELGANVYSGSFAYCWRAAVSPKVIIPIISGWVNVAASLPGQEGPVPTSGFFSYWGQFAPAPGLFVKNTK